MKSLYLGALLALCVSANTPTFKLCDDQGDGVLVIDTTQTRTDPADVEKGDHVTLYVDGLVTDNVKLDLLELDVYWAGTFL